jgi:tRNA threonylcarbamoyladenosine biosynthesis protein TsaE
MHAWLADAAATESLGAALAGPLATACLRVPFVVHLRGPLGAGKTTFARGLLRGLGHAGRVRSPTFTLLEPYELEACSVTHLDLYRVGDPSELDYLGLADLLSAGNLVLVEWAERGGDRLPTADLRVSLDYDGNGRRVLCEALTPAADVVIAAARQGLATTNPA